MSKHGQDIIGPTGHQQELLYVLSSGKGAVL